MDTVFIWPCECWKHKFVFPAAPPQVVECVCPECKKIQKINPTKLKQPAPKVDRLKEVKE